MRFTLETRSQEGQRVPTSQQIGETMYKHYRNEESFSCRFATICLNVATEMGAIAEINDTNVIFDFTK